MIRKSIHKGTYYMQLMQVANCSTEILNIYDSDKDNVEEREVSLLTAFKSDGENDSTIEVITYIKQQKEAIKFYTENYSPELSKKNKNLATKLDKLKAMKTKLNL